MRVTAATILSLVVLPLTPVFVVSKLSFPLPPPCSARSPRSRARISSSALDAGARPICPVTSISRSMRFSSRRVMWFSVSILRTLTRSWSAFFACRSSSSRRRIDSAASWCLYVHGLGRRRAGKGRQGWARVGKGGQGGKDAEGRGRGQDVGIGAAMWAGEGNGVTDIVHCVCQGGGSMCVKGPAFSQPRPFPTRQDTRTRA